MGKGVSTTSDATHPAGFCVGRMFDQIAPTYDLLNHLLSFGFDFSWRRKAARCIEGGKELRVVDLATGTADLLIALLRERPGVCDAVGLDCSEEMLKVGREKVGKCGLSERVSFVRDDATRTSLSPESFDVVTMGFGIRNTPDARKTLDEIHRLLKPGGVVVILEFSLPTNRIVRRGYLTYLRFGVPLIGAVVSRDRQAYRYLNRSIEAFHGPAEFCSLMEQAGFRNVSATALTGGVASIYKGSKALDGA